MLRNLFALLAYVTIFVTGMGVPFAMTLGYVWTDMFRPQAISPVLAAIPLSLFMALAAFGGYVLADRRSPPRLSLLLCMTIAFGFWVTATCLWAELPDISWIKWDWAFASIVICAFIPFSIRSKTQIEAFLQVFLFSLAANFIPFGVKAILGGGAYGKNFGILTGNAFLAEGDTLAAACAMSIPIALYLYRHSTLIPLNRLTKLGYVGLAGLAGATIIGTHERGALVGLIAVAVAIWMKSKRKIASGILLAGAGFLVTLFASASWFDRMSSINDRYENSIGARLQVWKWTLDYVSRNPLGGGFDMFHINTIEIPNSDTPGDVTIQHGRAFHSIYFEALGEHGWIGLGLFVGLMIVSLWYLQQVARDTRNDPDRGWCRDLASALQCGLVAYIVTGAFVGIAFQPFAYYFFGLACTLREYMWRSAQASLQVPKIEPSWMPARAGYPHGLISERTPSSG